MMCLCSWHQELAGHDCRRETHSSREGLCNACRATCLIFAEEDTVIKSNVRLEAFLDARLCPGCGEYFDDVKADACHDCLEETLCPLLDEDEAVKAAELIIADDLTRARKLWYGK